MSYGRSNRKLAFSLALLGLSVLSFASCGSKKPQEELDNETSEVQEVIKQADTIPDGITVAGVSIGGMELDQARQTIQNAADQLMSKIEINLNDEGSSWPLKPDDIGLSANIDQTFDNVVKNSGNSNSFSIYWNVDEPKMNAAFDEIAAEINTELTEPYAEYTPEGPDRFAFHEGTPGKSLDTVALSANIVGALNRGDTAINLQLPLISQQPTKTLEEVKANLVRIVVVNTSFSGNSGSPRVKNLELGAQKINGKMVKPGHEFSFNDVVGPRDARNGWELAATIVGGNTFEDDYGGGICQVSTTLYNAVLKSDLKVSKRNKHSIPSSYVPYGLDATVAYGSKDFKFVNNTDYPIYIFASVDKKEQKVYVSIYGRPLPDNRSIVLRSTTVKETDPQAAEVVQDSTSSLGSTTVLIKERKGYTVKVNKEYVVDGKVVETVEMYTDTYSPVRGVISVGSSGGPVELNAEADAAIPEEGVEPPVPAEEPQEQIPEEIIDEEPQPQEEEPRQRTEELVDLTPDEDGSIEIPDMEELE